MNTVLFLLTTTAPTPTEDSAATLKTVATLTFFAIFLGVVVWLVLAKRKQFDDAAQLPLEDQKIITPRKNDTPDDTLLEDASHG